MEKNCVQEIERQIEVGEKRRRKDRKLKILCQLVVEEVGD